MILDNNETLNLHVMNSDSDDCGTIKHSVRIRFTIGNNSATSLKSNTESSDNDPKSASTFQDVEHHDHSSFTEQNKTSQTECQISCRAFSNRKKGRSFKFIEPKNHKSALFVNLSGNSVNNLEGTEKQLFISPKLSPITTSCTSLPISESTLDSSSYELIDWEEEKKGIEEGDRLSKSICSFVGPFHKIADVIDSNMSHSCNFINWMSGTRRKASSITTSLQSNSAEAIKDDVSGDNLSPPKSSKPRGIGPNQQAGRRALSSEQLDRPEPSESSLLSSNRTTSGNHLAMGASVETVCGSDQTQTKSGSEFVPRNSATVQPLEIEIGSPQMDHAVSPFSASSHPVSLDDILKIEMDDFRFEEEFKALEAEAQYWEQKVESLERQQFAEDVPRTLVDSIIKHRRELRDLEYEIYKRALEYEIDKRALDSEESDILSCEGRLSQKWLDDSSPSDLQSPVGNKYIDTQMYPMNDVDCIDNQLVEDMDESLNLCDARASGKFGSQLKPGQENTADVLDAIPPPSSLQRRQYLNRASSGTDTSEFSQLPTFNQHAHKLVRHHQINYQPFSHGEERFSNDDIVKNHEHHHRRRHHHHHHHQQSSSSQHRSSRRIVHQQRQLYVHVDKPEGGKINSTSPNRGPRASPIRPDHFKSEFRSPHVVAAQDSSSTASSSSPQ